MIELFGAPLSINGKLRSLKFNNFYISGCKNFTTSDVVQSDSKKNYHILLRVPIFRDPVMHYFCTLCNN